MSDNVLKATIQVTAPGVKETFAQVANSTKQAEGNLNQLGTTVTRTEAIVRQLPPTITETSLTLKDQRAILVALERQYSSLSTAQAKSRIGRELAADIKVANAEIKRLEVGAVSSFGAIGKSATKGFSAIRQLAFILPGIGIAGIFNLAFTAIEQLISGFDSLSKKTKLYKEISDQLAKGVAEDLTKLTSLVGLVQNVNTSNDDRVKGLKALNEQYAQYLPNLDKEGITLQNISAAYDAIVQSLLRQAVVKGLQKEIQAEVEKTASQIIRYREAEERRRIASEAANKATGDTTTAIQAANQKLQQYNQTVRDGNQALAGRTAELKRNATNFGATSIERLTAELKKQLEPLLNLTTNFEDLDIKLKGEKQVGSEIDKIIAHGKRLAAQFGKLGEIRLDILPIFSELDTKAEQLKKAQQIIKDVNQFFNDFSSKQRALKLIIPIAPDLLIGPIDPKVVPETQAEITRILKEVAEFKPEDQKFDVTIDIAVKLGNFKDQLKADLAAAFNITPDLTGTDAVFQKLVDIQNQAVFAANTITGVLTPAFQNLFSAILSGEDPLKSFFQGLGQAVQQLIQKLVAAAIQALILSAIFGTIGGASGFGAIFAKLLGFEKGGRPPVGKPSVVGEGGHEIFMPDVGKPILVGVGGPHLFTPERAGKIIPNYKVNDYSKLVSTDKATNVSQSLVARYSDSTDKVKEISNSISKIVTTVLDKVARFQSTTLDKVAEFHSSVSSSFEKVIGWSRERSKDFVTNNTVSKEIRYVDKQSSKEGLKEIYKLFSSDVTDHKFVQSRTASTSKELYSVAALKEISNTLAKVFEYSTASTTTGKVERSVSTLEKTIHSAFESTYSGLIEKLASVYKTDTSKYSLVSDQINSAFASLIKNSYDKTDSTFVRDSVNTHFQSLVTSATSSIKELKELFTNQSLIKNDSKETSHSSTVFESIKSFTSSIVQKFTNTIERLLSSVATRQLQPIPVSQITNITRAASTLNNLTKNVQFRAAGGPVSRNAPTIVGEKGWELFTPKVSGHIIPHHKVNEYLKNLYKSTATEKVFRSTRNIKDLNLSKIFNRRITNISELTHKELSTIIGKQFAGFRAGGGFVGGGSTIAVGERNFELFVPNTGASIITNNNNAGGVGHVAGGTLKVEGNIRIAGSDLIAVIANASRSQSRLS